MAIPDIAWQVVTFNLLHLGVAWVLALPVAWDSEKHGTGAGLRTFPLVAVTACGFSLVGMSVLESTEAESRVLQGLITGIGFIGGGAILKSDGTVSGTATAAAIWTTGLIGIAVAFNRFEIAILLSVITFLTMHYVRRIKDEV